MKRQITNSISGNLTNSDLESINEVSKKLNLWFFFIRIFNSIEFGLIERSTWKIYGILLVDYM